MARNLFHRSAFIVVVITFTILTPGCAFTPGMQIEAGPQGLFRSTPTEAQEEDDYVLVPVTEKLVSQMEAEVSPKAHQIPPEWEGDAEHYVYRVGRADELQVLAWGHPELSLVSGAADTFDAAAPAGASIAPSPNAGPGILVDDQGMIFFPLIGLIPVAGKTTREIRVMMASKLKTYLEEPQIDVRVIGFRSKRVHVSGEVKLPRDVPITNVPLRLLDAINAAGGTGGAVTSTPMGATAGSITTTLKPDLDDVRIIRNGKRISVSLLDIYDRGRADENLLLQDGDTVHVPNLDAKKIYVMGEVRAPGLQAFERGTLTLAAALQKSGGLNQESAEGTRLLVLRGGKTKPVVYYFNLNQPKTVVLSTRFPLKPSDVVYAATADISKFQRVVQAFMPIIQSGIYAGALSTR